MRSNRRAIGRKIWRCPESDDAFAVTHHEVTTTTTNYAPYYVEVVHLRRILVNDAEAPDPCAWISG